MNTMAPPIEFTPEDLLKMPEAKGYELIDGKLVEKNVGTLASWVGGEINRLLGNFCHEHRVGWVFNAEASYQCFSDRPNLVRKPDVSFVRLGRLPKEEIPEGHTGIPPDLAVELVSPKDLFYEVDRKTSEYLQAGVRLVWVANPDTRIVYIYRKDGSIVGLREADELTGGDVLPGFRCRVRDLFPAPVVQESNPQGQ